MLSVPLWFVSERRRRELSVAAAKENGHSAGLRRDNQVGMSVLVHIADSHVVGPIDANGRAIRRRQHRRAGQDDRDRRGGDE